MALLAETLWSQSPIFRLLDASIARDLEARGTISAALRLEAGLTLAPRVDSRERLAAEARRFQPTVGIEILRVIRGASAPLDTPQGLLRLYNILHAASTMKGITYFSASRKREIVLFTESYAIESLKNASRIADPIFTSVPTTNTMYTFQADQSFGKSAYKQDFTIRADHLLVGIENLSTISLFFVPLIRPGALVSRLVLVPSGVDLVFYGLSYIRTTAPLGNAQSREESLANRLIALTDWLENALRN